MRKVSSFLAAILLVGATTARAQMPPAPEEAPKQFYAGFASGVTVGHVVSPLFDVELGRQFTEHWDVYLEVGRMLDTRTAALDEATTVIVTFLGPGASAVPKQPVNYGDIGARYKFPPRGRLQPYAGLGLGIAKVQRNVAFLVNGTNVNATLLDTYGVQLGSDSSGAMNRALLTFMVGAQVPLRDRVFGDVSYRFGRVFLPDEGLSTNRLQVGIGVRF